MKILYSALALSASLICSVAHATPPDNRPPNKVEVRPNNKVNNNVKNDIHNRVNSNVKNNIHNSTSSRSSASSRSQSNSRSSSTAKSANFNGNVNLNRTGDSFSGSNSSVDYQGGSNTLNSAFGNGSNNPNFTSNYETDDLYLTLPSVGSMMLPENTNPGITAQCQYINFNASYTGGDSTGLRLYLFEFQRSNTPDTITGQEMITLVGTCGVIEQLKGLEGHIDENLLDAAKELSLDKLMQGLYQLHGEEYNSRMLQLETIGKTSSGVGEGL